MNWRHKAKLAALFAKLPAGLSYQAYYFMQRHFGNLRSVNPERGFRAAITILDLMRQQGKELTGRETFLEVGTGRTLSLPIALWLCGAFRVITFDLNPYLKAELVLEEIDFLKRHGQEVSELFGKHGEKPVFHERFDSLTGGSRGLEELLRMMNIQYWAPADAGRVDLPSQSIDYHISFMVAQHVRPTALVEIFLEGKRLIKPDGLFIHYATLTDLFAGIDTSISPINFLRFGEAEWEVIAGNRYMYHNRLRVDELSALIQSTGLRILAEQTELNQEALGILREGKIPLDERFRGNPPETNATGKVWITAALSSVSGEREEAFREQTSGRTE
jgi:hypothetical protein